MKRKEIKFMAILLIVTCLLLGFEVREVNLNKQYQDQLEQYHQKLDAGVKVLDTKNKEIQDQASKLNTLQKEIDEQITKIQKLGDELKDISVKTDMSNTIENYVEVVAKENGYRPELLLGMIQTESEWNLTKVSSTHDYGLCQINQSNFRVYEPLIFKKYGNFDVFNPYESIDMMIMNLNEFRDMYQDKYKAVPQEASLLLAYNSGNIKSNFGGNSYTTKVLGNTEQYGKWLGYVSEVSNLRKIIS